MFEKIQLYLNKIPPILRNKYIITLILFIIWYGLIDTNNIFSRIKDLSEINQMQKDKIYYLHKIEETKAKLDELRTNNANLEKYAREQFFLKKSNEDIFLIVEESDSEEEDE